MPAMIACERCDECGGLPDFCGSRGDVVFDAARTGSGGRTGFGGRLVTASAGQLVGKGLKGEEPKGVDGTLAIEYSYESNQLLLLALRFS